MELPLQAKVVLNLLFLLTLVEVAVGAHVVFYHFGTRKGAVSLVYKIDSLFVENFTLAANFWVWVECFS
jgi:hypothetical protein